MTTSKTIAGLIGPTLVAIAASMLLNIGSFPALAEQVSRDPALIFVSGILLFVAGLAIVRIHNRWTNGWPVLGNDGISRHRIHRRSRHPAELVEMVRIGCERGDPPANRTANLKP